MTALERYLRAIRRQAEFQRVLLPPGVPRWPVRSFREFQMLEARNRRIREIRRAVADAILEDRIVTVCIEIREQQVGDSLFLLGVPRGDFEDLKDFLREGLIVSDEDGVWWLNREHPIFVRQRTLFSREAYSIAYRIANRELRERRREWFARNREEIVFGALYEGVEAFVEGAALARLATARRLLPRAQPIGPARNMPRNDSVLPADIADDGRVLLGGGAIEAGLAERATFRVTERTQYAVRVGRGGSYFDHLFDTVAEARAYARREAAGGRAVIRRDRALPRVWSDGAPGNPVDAFYIYEIPAEIPVLQGTVARQRAASGVVYPGGGPQVNVGRPSPDMRFREVETIPITAP